MLTVTGLLADEHQELWIQKTAGVLKTFPLEHFTLIKVLFAFLSDFLVHSDENLMGTSSIATVIAPNVFKSRGTPSDLNELHEGNRIIELFVIHNEKIISMSEQLRMSVDQ